MINNTPCQNCDNRFVGCHTVCTLYKVYRMEIDKVNNKRKYNKMMQQMELDKYIRLHRIYGKK